MMSRREGDLTTTHTVPSPPLQQTKEWAPNSPDLIPRFNAAGTKRKPTSKPGFWARVLKDFGTLGFVRKTWIYWARVVGLLKSGVYSETTWIYSELVPLDFWNLEIVLKTWIYWALPLTFETWGLFWKLGSTELLSLGFWNLGFDLKTWNNWARVIGLLKPGVCYENLDLYTELVFVLSLLVKARL